MAKKYVALYIQGRKIPFGAMRQDIAEEVIKDLKIELRGSYELKPVTKAEYKRINRDLKDNLENLIRRYEKK